MVLFVVVVLVLLFFPSSLHMLVSTFYNLFICSKNDSDHLVVVLTVTAFVIV